MHEAGLYEAMVIHATFLLVVQVQVIVVHEQAIILFEPEHE